MRFLSITLICAACLGCATLHSQDQITQTVAVREAEESKGFWDGLTSAVAEPASIAVLAEAENPAGIIAYCLMKCAEKLGFVGGRLLDEGTTALVTISAPAQATIEYSTINVGGVTASAGRVTATEPVPDTGE